MNDASRRATIDPSTQGQKVTLGLGSPQVIPQPTSRTQRDLLFGSMIVNLPDGRLSPIEIVAQSTVQPQALGTDALISLGLDGLHPPATLRPMSADGFEVQCGRDDLDVGQGELRALSDDLAVEGDQGGSIIVQPVSVASLLIGVEVDTSELSRCALACIVFGLDALYSP